MPMKANVRHANATEMAVVDDLQTKTVHDVARVVRQNLDLVRMVAGKSGMASVLIAVVSNLVHNTAFSMCTIRAAERGEAPPEQPTIDDHLYIGLLAAFALIRENDNDDPYAPTAAAFERLMGRRHDTPRTFSRGE